MSDDRINKDINTCTDDKIPSGMLSSPQIEYCVKKYKIIKNFKKEQLGSATYNMRIGGEVLAWDRDRKVEFTLGKDEDKNKNIKNSLEFKPNSLTFVTTIEKFQLTKDIIARFNLKSVLVHKGLLLGTGPIVDPQLHARLLIPIHNFSNKVITLSYGDELISVEFTKTLDPDMPCRLPTGEYAIYIDNENWNFDPRKYRKRIGDNEVASSVKSQFEAYDDTIKFYENKIKEITTNNEQEIAKIVKEKNDLLRTSTRWNLIGLLGVIAAIGALFYMSWDLMTKAQDKADAAYNLVKQFDNTSVDFRSLALKTDLNELQIQVKKIEDEFSKIGQESFSSSEDIKIHYKNLIENYDRKFNQLEYRIEMIENKIAYDGTEKER
jgi:deoxycytidine triphosphate deaminase